VRITIAIFVGLTLGTSLIGLILTLREIIVNAALKRHIRKTVNKIHESL
jgi:hypothetical protein